MNFRSVTILFTILTVGCHATSGPPTKVETITPNLDPNLTRTYTWAETGLKITLLPGWRRDDNGSDAAERAWARTDDSTFNVNVSTAVSNKTIDDDTTHYYETQAGSEDLRYINVDGVRGVHFLRSGKSLRTSQEDEKSIFWSAQRMWGDQRELIRIVLTTPAQSFEKNRDLLYSLLGSVKFDSNKNTAESDESPGKRSSVVVSIPAEDEFYLGKHRTQREEIPAEVDKMLRDRTSGEQTWYLKARATVSCETVLKLRDDIAAVGYERVGLVADKDTSRQTPSPPTRTEESNSSKAANAQTNPEDQSRFDIFLGLSKSGTPIIKVNDNEVSPNELSRRTRALHSQADKQILISVAPAVPYGALTDLIDLLKKDALQHFVVKLEQR